ncbi:hypothetical protein OIU74_021272 [Salix koriyanagi]|uniref:Uncharacterized protein n=1 Tax=Salix koriyanagi TaxID=2511006 RepID=A0A9Q0P7R3_9ROSI|nr:hypothetical protein OIU74_021272 [Salix koriyanagi]
MLGEGLPSSLSSIEIWRCPLLDQRYPSTLAFHFYHERPLGETECLPVCHADIFPLADFHSSAPIFGNNVHTNSLTAFMPLKLELDLESISDQHILTSHIAVRTGVPTFSSKPFCSASYEGKASCVDFEFRDQDP